MKSHSEKKTKKGDRTTPSRLTKKSSSKMEMNATTEVDNKKIQSSIAAKNEVGLQKMRQLLAGIAPDRINDEVKDHLVAIHQIVVSIIRRRQHYFAYKNRREGGKEVMPDPTMKLPSELTTACVIKQGSKIGRKRSKSLTTTKDNAK